MRLGSGILRNDLIHLSRGVFRPVQFGVHILERKADCRPAANVVDSIEQVFDSLESRAALSVMLDPAATARLEEKLDPSVCAGSTIALWVGPESGWSATQSECLKARGVEAGRLGQSVLRAETAGPVAVAVARLLIGDW